MVLYTEQRNIVCLGKGPSAFDLFGDVWGSGRKIMISLDVLDMFRPFQGD